MHVTALLRSTLTLLLVVSPTIVTASTEEPRYVVATIDGERMRVRDDRRPSLYTADYGDCLGESAINVTRFDAAYYRDNMTITFHLAGETALTNESIMMNIGVYAYGESRFDLTFNPCNANIWSACPVQSGTPIEAAGIIPVSQNDVSGIPDLALGIPDFEGEAILRLFSNSTQTEIAYHSYAAQITNGNTFQQKAAVGSILGVFTLVAIVASFATAVGGDNITVMRKHYAHSVSVFAVFAVWHHIFFSGALSMNWPSVLVAFWSNYAWAGGMIYSEHMQNTINDFIGANKGNTSHVGAAGTGINNPNLGGGYDIHQIYRRDNLPRASSAWDPLAKRDLVDASSGFTYYGQPVKPGLPLPGNYSGFSGTLAQERIPASNAFMTGFLWFLILTASVFVSILAFKVVLDGLRSLTLIKKNRLAFFRAHFLAYAMIALLRTFFIGFFMMAFLTMFQFSYLALSGPVAVACVVFVAMVFGLGSIAAFACYSRIRAGKYASKPDHLNVERREVLKIMPWHTISQESKSPRSEDKVYAFSAPWWTLHPIAEAGWVHEDELYTKDFGWLASRYRRTRWWFFVVWLIYEFVRACFLAGASGHPMIQVFGLLVVELFAFIEMIYIRPFEGQRLNIIVVYLLGFSKVTTVALSASFDTRFNLPRITATVLGIIIIVIQSVLTIAVMIAIVSGAITSYLSIMRDHEDFKPKRWGPLREKYFKCVDLKARDVPPPRPLHVKSSPEVPRRPYFHIKQVQRMPKVEDEDDEFMQGINSDPSVSHLLLASPCDEIKELPSQRSRSVSIQSHTSHHGIPRAARLHRASWTPQKDPERRKTARNTMTFTPEGPSGLSSRALPHLNTQLGSRESVDSQPGPLGTSTSWPSAPATSPSTHAGGRAPSRLTLKSRSSSRPILESSISEER